MVVPSANHSSFKLLVWGEPFCQRWSDVPRLACPFRGREPRGTVELSRKTPRAFRLVRGCLPAKRQGKLRQGSAFFQLYRNWARAQRPGIVFSFFFFFSPFFLSLSPKLNLPAHTCVGRDPLFIVQCPRVEWTNMFSPGAYELRSASRKKRGA